MSDNNNSSFNNFFGNFVSVNESEDTNYEFLENQMVCIDTSNHRIGINTIDPTCSLDISGLHGKINVNSISCENLNVSGLNIYDTISNLDNSLSIILTSNNDASFGNVDISGNLDVGGLNVYDTISNLDNSLSTILTSNNDASFGNVDISGNLDLSKNKVQFVISNTSIGLQNFNLYYDASGFVKIYLE